MPKSVRVGAAYDACAEREREREREQGAEVRGAQSGLRPFGRMPGDPSLMRIQRIPARSARPVRTTAAQRMS